MTSHYDLEVSLKEIKRAFDANGNSFQLTRDSAQSLLQVSSLLVGLYTIFQSYKFPLLPEEILNLRPYVLIALYLAMAALTIWLIRPVNVFGPVEMTWEEISEAYQGKSEEGILLMQCSSYLKALQKNKGILAKRHKILNAATIILVAIVIIIIL